MKRLLKAIAGGASLCLLLSLCGFEGECREIRENVVRLHILANSDTAEDQALKLKVRDAVVETAGGWLDTITDEAQALEHIREKMPALQAVAQQTVYDNGYTYAVDICLCRMYFETRQYDKVVMPAGTYEALRIVIGEGKGKNWWCVLYPPMCIRSAVKAQKLSDVLDHKQMNVVTGAQRYAIRFKVVEIAQWLLDKFR